MSVLAIDIQGVRKAFKRRERDAGAPWWRREQKEKVALHELDLIVEAGGVTGILGPLGWPKDVIDQPMEQLSRGQQQKVAIARSFLTAPSLLLMDEPTTGLDPRCKKEVQAVLETLRAEREITVLLCTHDMDEASALCDRVLMLDGGRVLADGSPDELPDGHGAGTP